MDPASINQSMAQIQAVYGEIFPDHTFEYPYMDDSIVAFYNAETTAGILFKVFARYRYYRFVFGLVRARICYGGAEN
ncbi:MAG: hypothetical protein ABI415_02525 [Flavitalea sp.]